MKKLPVIGLVILAVLALGCFNYTSIMQIDEDGSGTLVLDFETPLKENLEINIHEFEQDFDSIEGWQTTAMATDTLDTTVVFHLEGKFESPLVTANISFADSFSFRKEETEEGYRFHLSSKFESLDGSLYFKSTKALIRTLIKYNLDEYIWCEKLLLPGKIITHNADVCKGDTLIWQRNIMDLAKDGLIIEAVWEVAK